VFISSILRQHISANVIFMFEYFILRLEDKFERLFDTRLQSIQPGEVDEFRQPRVWILLQPRLQVQYSVVLRADDQDPSCQKRLRISCLHRL
jgi:hypothetical protein